MNKGKTVRQKKRKNTFQKLGASIVAIALVIAMAMGTVSSEVVAAVSSDLGTTSKFTESLGDNASTEYAGRIWTDKSVFTEDATFKSFGGSEQTVTKGEDDFLVAFSALATSQAVSGQAQTPLDVVFVIDMSGSMRQNTMDNGKTRMANTIAALNSSVEALLETSPQARVGVVAFSGEAYTLLELDHYTKLNGQSFFSTNKDESRIYTKAVGEKTGTINKTTTTSTGTNIQRGIHDGLAMLLSVTDTTVVVDGQEVQRAPSVILLSDGAPTIGSDFESWWDLSGDTKDYDYDTERALYSMQAIMTASYMKDAIDRHYGIVDTAYATRVYSIGMGIQQISGENKNIASIAINPAAHIDKNNATSNTIREAWNKYLSDNNTGTPKLKGKNNKDYTFKHPNTGYDIDSIAYVDQYYDADDAASVTSVFDSIVSSISISAPEVPTEHDVSKPLESGYITYTDPIGEYMEVKDMKTILYAGQQYSTKTKTTSGTATDYVEKYVFEGGVTGNPVYGTHQLKEIIIEVHTTVTDGIKDQEVIIKIPAGAIPIRVNTVELNVDGSVKSHTNNGTYPVRVLYTVGIQEGIIESAGANEYVNAQKISAEYLANNTNEDGTINFYSNIYTGTNVVNGHTAGDATVEFEPSHSNPFYYIQENTPIYTNEGLTDIANASAEIVDDQIYYYADEHYHGNTKHAVPIERTGAQLKNAGVVNIDGQWHRPVGSPRLNRILEFEGTKTANTTNTAQDFYAPTFVQTGETAYDGKFVVYLGNNGIVTANAGGNLEISKTVTADVGLTAPDKEFTFTVDFEDAAGTYNYHVVDSSNTTVGSGTISDGGTIKLKDGQKATIVNLPPSAKYTVTETAVAGFTTTINGNVSGTIAANETKTVGFVNNYAVTPVEYNGLTATKTLDGRDWKSTDEFAFTISSPDGSPLPANPNVELTGKTATDGEAVAFDFGKFTFTKPGTFNYTIVELTPGMADEERLVGVSYTREVYELKIVVTDKGDGTLEITSADLTRVEDEMGQEVNESAAVAAFTNIYQVDNVHYGPVAIKNYTDKSDNKPLTDGMFTFQMKASDLNTESVVPMPAGTDASGIYTAHNVGTYVAFGQVEFTNAHVGKTYYYELSEVDGGVNGMTYDEAKTIVKVEVTSEDVDGVEVVKVTPTYMDETQNPLAENNATFTNVYEPKAAIVKFEGTKTMIGRDMLEEETFSFTWKITGNHAFTGNEFRNNMGLSEFVLEPEVSGGTNGAAKEIDLGQLEIRKPGTYYFSLTENIPTEKAGGVTYDEVEKLITIEVIDNAGVLEATVTYDNGTVSDDTTKAVFVNTYEAASTDPISFSGKKTVTGRALEEGKFFFDVTPLGGAPMGAKTILAIPDADGNIPFLTDITFTEAGTYSYIVREQIPAGVDANNKLDGYTYDDIIYRITVTVTDNKEGKLLRTSVIEEVTESVVDGNVVYTAVRTVDEITFHNTYETTPESVTPLQMTKVLEGKRNEGLKAGEFTFKKTIVSGVDGGATFGTYPNIVTETTITNDANGIVQFGDITFIKPGTYVIQIEEVAGNAAGITYDTHKVQSTFEVTDDGAGNLVVIRTNTTGSREFVNVYESQGTIGLSVKKNLTGRTPDEWLASDNFTFVLEANNEATLEAIEAGKVSIPAGAGRIGITIDASNAPDYQKAFGDIVIREAGEYEFRIRELDGGILGVNYDASSKVIHVTAVDNGDGTLTVSAPAEEMAAVFNNVYDPGTTVLTGHGNLHVTKEFTGRANNEWLDSDSFQFVLSAGDTATANAITAKDVVLSTETDTDTVTINHDNNGVGHFGNITFKKVGTYTFKVTEVLPAGATAANNYTVDGITYTTVEKFVTVEVTDTGAGVLAVEVSNLDENGYLTFTNTYDAKPASVEEAITVNKVLTGRNWTADDAFTFVIEADNEETQTALGNGSVILADSTLEIKEANKTDAFGLITFKKAGVYSFVVSEQIPADADKATNLSYDGHVETITYAVEDNTDGQLVVTSVEKSANEMVWENIYRPFAAETQLKAVKAISGREWKSGDKFTFLLSAEDGTPMPASVFATTNDVHEAVFGEITFDEVGVYKYYISEVGSYDGLTNDSRTLVATVTVTNNMEGSLVASVAYEMTGSDPAATTFVNTYSSEGELEGQVHLKVTKNFTGRTDDEWLASDSFTFTLAADVAHEATKAALDAGQIIMPAAELVVNSTNKDNAHFGNIKFTKTGTYQFIIKENAGSIDGVKYDTAARTVVVKVTDNWDGTLTAVATSASDELTFNNKYNASGTLAGLTVTKNFTGRDWLASDSFKFVLEPADAVTQAALGRTVSISGVQEVEVTAASPNKQATFGNFVFKAAGTYKFIVREVKPATGAVPGVEYDGKARLVTIVVTDNEDGTLTAVSSITETAENGEAVVSNLVFENKYSEEETTLSGHNNLHVEKVLEGRAWTDEDKFEFTLEAYSANAKDTAKVTINEPTTITVDANNREYVHFGDITFKATGDYQFLVKETVPADKFGITYDETVRIVTIGVGTQNVEVDGHTKVVLKATVKSVERATVEGNNVTVIDSAADNKISFTNVYDAKPVTLSGAANLEVTKALVGREWNSSDAFTFEIKAHSENAQDAALVTMNTPTTIDVTSATKKNAFGDIVFKEEGTYVFGIVEVDKAYDNITIDPDHITVTVTVVDDGKGNLVATPSYSAPLEFTNTFTPSPINVSLEALKVVTESDGTVIPAEHYANKFTFVVSRPEDSAPTVPHVHAAAATEHNDETGKIEFVDVLTFTEPGTYVYHINEVAGDLSGIAYDNTTIEATITVTYNPATGTLHAADPVYSVPNAQFTNVYNVTPTSFELSATKEVVEHETNTYVMAAGDFEFSVLEDKDNPLSTIGSGTVVVNDADGNIDLLDVVYSEAGTYKYYVEEVDKNVAGFNYDYAIYEVIVNVADKDAKLVVDSYEIVKYEHGEAVATSKDASWNGIVFTNTFHDPFDTEVFEGRKYLSGRDIADGEFAFVLEAVSGPAGVEIPMPQDATTHNVGNVVRFGEIKFTEVGTYEYRVSEVIPATAERIPGVTYDNNSFKVVVTVTEETTADGHNDIVAAVSYPEEVIFNNSYAPASVSESFEGIKTLRGRDLRSGEFKFTLTPVSYEDANGHVSTDASDIPMPKDAVVSNAADGSFEFGTIKFTKVGTYRYTVTENEGTLGGVTYDSNSYDVLVTVTDEGFDGQLDAEVTFYDEDEVAKEITFINSYETHSAKAVLEGGFKTLHGRPLQENEFEFEIKAVSGPAGVTIPMPEKTVVTNDVIGHISFGSIEYVTTGTYKYEIVEIDNGLANVTYDKEKFEVTVTVTDNLEGHLVADVSGMTEVNFENSYAPNLVPVKVEGLKTLSGRSLQVDEFTFDVLFEDGNGTHKTVKNDRYGKITLIDDAFDKKGTYTYYFKEVLPDEAIYDAQNDVYSLNGIVYDAVAYKYTFTIKSAAGRLYLDEAATTLEVVDRDTLEVVANASSVDRIVFQNEYIAPKLTIAKKQALGNGTAGTADLEVKEGDKVTYFITVSNTANYSVAKDVTITDQVPEGLVVDLTSVSDGGQVNNGVITWTFDELKGGTTKTVSFAVTVPDVAEDTEWDNMAVLTYGDEPQDSNEVTIKSGAPELVISKLQKVNDGQFTKELLEAFVGDTVTYSITVKNTGSEAAENVEISDEIPAGLQFVAGSAANATVNGSVITWSVGTLEVNEEATVSFQVTVPKVEKDTRWTNVATVVYGNDPTNPDDPQESNEVVVETKHVAPVLTISKAQKVNDGITSTSKLAVVENDEVTYYLTVANTTLTSDAKEVVITDVIPEGLTLVANSISNYGEEHDGTITWNIGDLAGGEQVTVSFTVTVPDVAEDTEWENVATVTHTIPTEDPTDDPDETEEETKESNEVEIEEGAPELVVSKLQKVNDGQFTNELLEVFVGDTVTYSITVKNIGSEAAAGVVITDEIPAGLTFIADSVSGNVVVNDNVISWVVGPLAVGEEQTVSFAVTVPKVDKDTSWTNVATAVYGNDPTNPDDPEESNEVTVETEYVAPELEIIKKQQANDGEATTNMLAVVEDDVVTYYITVTNTTSTADAKEVVITDEIPEGLTLVENSISDNGTLADNTITWNIGDLVSGQSVTVSFQVTVPDVAEDTEWENVATVKQTVPTEDPTDAPDATEEDTEESNEVVIGEGAPAVTITKEQKVNEGEFTKEVLEALVGDTVTYNLTVKSTGTETATGVVITDEIPAGLELVADSVTDNGTVDGNVITWTIGTLAVNEEVTVSFQVTVPKVDKDTSWTNIATAVCGNDPTPDQPEESNEVTVETEYVAPELTISKTQKVNEGTVTADKLTVVEGDVVTYYLTVTNTTLTSDAKEVVITDVIPEGLTLVADSISNDGEEKDGTITWNIGELAGGEDVTVSFQVTVPDVAVDTEWENMATVTQTVPTEDPTDDPDATEEDTEESNEVEIEEGVPALEIIKEQKVNEGEFTKEVLEALVGDTVTYNLTVKNTGTESAADVVITDEIPAGLELVAGSAAEDAVVEGNVISWAVGTLAAGEEKTVSFQVTVPKVDADTVWTNVATVVYDNDPTDPDQPEESNEVTVETEYVVPELEISKTQAVNDGKATADKLTVVEDDVVTYYITVKNATLTSDALDFVITDEIPAGLELVADSISNGGEEKDGTITWNIDRLVGGESVTVSFQVTVPDVAVDTAWTNVATVTQTVPTEEKSEESNEVEIAEGVPELTITKAQKVNLGKSNAETKSVRVGDIVIYSITVTNNGTETAEDITISDEIPSGLNLIKGGISKGGKVENGVITWTIEEIKAGKSVTVRFAVKVPNVLEDTTYKNIATVVYGNNPEGSDKPQESNEVVLENKVVAPQMGDATSITLWAATALTSLAVATGTLVQKRRDEE